MTSITIITIVVVALLTVIIFGLAWLGYSSCIKAYRVETDAGKHDEEILKEYHSKKKKSGLVGIICSYLALTALFGLFCVGVAYKASGENFSINNQTVLVIKSGSMSGYFDKELAEEYKEYPTYHFDVGDICVFESLKDETNLVKGEVYGYKLKDIIITHRLIGSSTNYNTHLLNVGDDLSNYNYFIDKDCMVPAIGEVVDASVEYYELVERYGYKFRGDNNSIYDPYTIKSENIIYHYTGHKVPGIGAFILYAQSIFGIWSLAGIIGVAVSSEIVYYQLNKINKARDKIIYNPEEKPAEEEIAEKPKRKIKAQFKRRDGTAVTIYTKEPTAEAPSKTHKEEEGAKDEK